MRNIPTMHPPPPFFSHKMTRSAPVAPYGNLRERAVAAAVTQLLLTNYNNNITAIIIIVISKLTMRSHTREKVRPMV